MLNGIEVANSIVMIEISNIKIPVLSFRSSGLMCYEVLADHRSRLLKSKNFISNASALIKRERYKGYVTDAVKKRMKKAITLLLQSTPYEWKLNPATGKQIHHKVSFITLTTPQHENSLNGKWCHKNLLEPMLRILRNKYQMKSYIWKIELQENGQVHYHLTSDIVINHTNLRNHWNNLLNKHDMLEQFRDKYGHTNPNSTDIHSVKKVKNLEAYLVKYITKEYQNEIRLNCKIWDCSLNLKKADYFKIHLDTPLHQYIRSLQNGLMVTTSYFEKAIFLNFHTNDYYSLFSEKIVNKFHNYLKSIRSWQNVTSTPNRTLAQNLKQVSNILENTLTACGVQKSMKLSTCCMHLTPE